MSAVVLLAAALLGQPAPLPHPAGVIPPTPNQVKAIRAKGGDFSKFAKGFKAIVPPRVDLTDRLPRPDPHGQGKIGSCYAWSLGYGVKSFHEAVEQGWEPTGDDHRFSPSYIYNQRANRPDGGMAVEDGLRVVMETGAVPWSRMPYEENDEAAEPDAALMAEGQAMQASGFMLVDPVTPDNIKLALASDLPVVLLMNTDTNFCEIRGNAVMTHYDADEVKQRHENGEGTGHAICAVGYDDEKHAVRILNSWGDDWADQGYAWIDYDLFVAADDVDFEDQFCMLALVVFDAPTVATRVQVKPAGGVRGRPGFAWEVAVEGRRQAIESLESVRYELGDDYRPAEIVRDDPAQGFGLASDAVQPSTAAEPLEVAMTLATRAGVSFQRRLKIAPEGAPSPPTGDGRMVDLPDLRGDDPAAASLKLMRLGLRPRIQRLPENDRPAGARPGMVSRQEPAPSRPVARGSTVTIYVHGRR